jgi:hypothetical protein
MEGALQLMFMWRIEGSTHYLVVSLLRLRLPHCYLPWLPHRRLPAQRQKVDGSTVQVEKNIGSFLKGRFKRDRKILLSMNGYIGKRIGMSKDTTGVGGGAVALFIDSLLPGG